MNLLDYLDHTDYSADPTPAYRVNRGAQWLDSVKPGWWELIDIDSLNLWSTSDCVLGQVFASEADQRGVTDGYCMVFDEDFMSSWPHKLNGYQITAYGFCSGGGFDSEEIRSAWIKLINTYAELDERELVAA